MKKKFLSFLMAVAMCLTICITAMPIVSAAVPTPFKVTPDKTEVRPGDTVTYTITMGAITGMGGLQIDIFPPAGLTLKAGNATLTPNLEQTLGAKSATINDNERVVVLVKCPITAYTGTETVTIGTFQCTVDQNASGKLTMDTVPLPIDENIEDIPFTVNNDDSAVTVKTYAKESGQSLTLKDCISENLYMELDSTVQDTDYMLFTLQNGKTHKVLVSEAPNEPGKGVKFTCPMVAKEMADTIKAEFYVDEKVVFTKEYSIVDYANVIMKNEGNQFTPETVELVRTMLNYGAAAQTYFNHNTANPANKGLTTEQKTVPETNAFDTYTFTKPDSAAVAAVGGIKYASSALNLESTIGIKHYFTLEEGQNIADYKFEVVKAGIVQSVLTPFTEKGDYCVEIPGISVADVTNTYTLRVTKGGNSFEVAYSVYTYGRMVKNVAVSGYENIKSLMNAMAAYHIAAVAYKA